MVKGTKLYAISGMKIVEITFQKRFNGRFYCTLEDGTEVGYTERRMHDFKASRILLLKELRDKLSDRLEEVQSEINAHEHKFKHL